MIKAILACDLNGGIGKSDSMPWATNKTDMKWFRDNTLGHIVIMGSKTWNSHGMLKPLPKRRNIVVTTRPENNQGADGYITENVVESVKSIKKEYPGLQVWLIGGANIIEQCWGIIDEFYITEIKDSYECDTGIDILKLKKNFILSHIEYEDSDISIGIWKRH